MPELQISAPKTETNTHITIEAKCYWPFEVLQFKYSKKENQVIAKICAPSPFMALSRLEFESLVLSLNAMVDDIKQCEEGTLCE